MVILNGFDAEQVEPSVGFDALPDGDYLVAVIGSEDKPTKKGNGSYLENDLRLFQREVWRH